MTERELLAECLRRLNALGMPFMLTGSMASNYWGIPRSTHDVDFVVEDAPDRERRIAAAFAPEFSTEEPAISATGGPTCVLRAVDPRSALRIDFWSVRRDGFAREAFSRRQPISLFGEPAWIATAEDTLLYKLHWNRVEDAAGIVAVQAENLDRGYLGRWGGVLGVGLILEDLMEGRVRPKQT